MPVTRICLRPCLILYPALQEFFFPNKMQIFAVAFYEKQKTMINEIHPVLPADYDEIVQVWESSVRATHHFLEEEDLLFYKQAIRNEYLPSGMLRLLCLKEDKGVIAGFMGLSEDSIEMLFIRPESRGQGVGKILLIHAIKELKKNKVDVNEQNEQAVGFYQHFGFKTISRSALDPSGKPYPILHMSL